MQIQNIPPIAQSLPSSILSTPLLLHFRARVRPAHHARFFLRAETSALHKFHHSLTCTFPTDDRELSLQKLARSLAPYGIMVTDSRRVHKKDHQREYNFYSGHHRTDSLHAPRRVTGAELQVGTVCHPELPSGDDDYNLK